MASKKRHRYSKKATPVHELLFLTVLLASIFILYYLQTMDVDGLGVIIGSFLAVALLVGGVFYLFLLCKQRHKEKAFRALYLAEVDTMTGHEFEKYVIELLRFQGYATRQTPLNTDYGVDIVASKDGIKIAVQTKRYAKKLDQKPVREAVAGMAVRKYGCTRAMVITNSTFTNAAIFLAKENNCELVDRKKLAEWILSFQDAALK